MLSSVVLVDCVIFICICRLENGRGVCSCVVMGFVVEFGGLFLCDCGCVWYIVIVCFGDIWWWSFVVTTLLSLVWVGQMSRIPDVP